MLNTTNIYLKRRDRTVRKLTRARPYITKDLVTTRTMSVDFHKYTISISHYFSAERCWNQDLRNVIHEFRGIMKEYHEQPSMNLTTSDGNSSGTDSNTSTSSDGNSSQTHSNTSTSDEKSDLGETESDIKKIFANLDYLFEKMDSCSGTAVMNENDRTILVGLLNGFFRSKRYSIVDFRRIWKLMFVLSPSFDIINFIV